MPNHQNFRDYGPVNICGAHTQIDRYTGRVQIQEYTDCRQLHINTPIAVLAPMHQHTGTSIRRCTAFAPIYW